LFLFLQFTCTKKPNMIFFEQKFLKKFNLFIIKDEYVLL